MNKINYGFDAPGIMYGLQGTGLLLVLAGGGVIAINPNIYLFYTAVLVMVIGVVLLILGISMFVYGTIGKFRVRDMMLGMVQWKGNEQVLDVGSGLGLLVNGAAKHLTTGKAIGIDLWSAKDLSDNTLENALRNAELEQVADRVEIRTEDARSLNFPDASFDVVLSLFCIHNIEDKAEQEKACFEIARVLKPNGVALIGDYIPTTQYAHYFRKAGLDVKSSKPYLTTAYSLTWMVEAVKR